MKFIFSIYLLTSNLFLSLAQCQTNDKFLFLDANSNFKSFLTKKRPYITRQKLLVINPLHQKTLSSYSWNKKNKIFFQLFNNEVVEVNLKKFIKRNAFNFSWIGNAPDQIAVLTVNRNSVAAHIEYKGKIYSIKPLDQEHHILLEHNEDFAISKKDYIEVNKKNFKLYDAELDSDDDGTFIDLLIIYTQDVEDASGDILAEIQNDIVYANLTLANSCANFRFRLVGPEKVTYVETGNMNQDISNLSLTGDGQLDIVQSTLRNDYGADLVQLWLESNNDYCGLGWKPSNINSMDSNYAYSIKLRSCSTTTTIHELGHNLTLNHDRYAQDVSHYNFNNQSLGAYGFVHTGKKFRTIMSYNQSCREKGFTCPRIPYFSNPRIVYQGSIIGIPKVCDAVTHMNQAAKKAAQYKSAITPANPDLTGCQENLDKNSKATDCFIATATYGSKFEPHVELFREFRDKYLTKNFWGRKFLRFYYRFSPSIAKIISKYSLLRLASKAALSPIIFLLLKPKGSIFVILLAVLLIYVLIKKRKKA